MSRYYAALILMIQLYLPIAVGEPLTTYYATLYRSNPLEQADIVLIGESHRVSLDGMMAALVIKSNARVGDILLIEGVDATMTFNTFQLADKRLAQVSEHMLIGGWDNAEAFEAELKRYKIAAIFRKEDSTNLQKMAAVPTLVSNLYWLDKLDQMRNTSLNETLRWISLRHPNKKIFLIAGRSHILENQGLLPTLESLKRPYIVLTPNINNPQRVEDQTDEYLKRNFGN